MKTPTRRNEDLIIFLMNTLKASAGQSKMVVALDMYKLNIRLSQVKTTKNTTCVMVLTLHIKIMKLY